MTVYREQELQKAIAQTRGVEVRLLDMSALTDTHSWSLLVNIPASLLTIAFLRTQHRLASTSIDPRRAFDFCPFPFLSCHYAAPVYSLARSTFAFTPLIPSAPHTSSPTISFQTFLQPFS